MNIISKKLLSILLVISIFLMSTKAFALEEESFDDYSRGKEDGRAKAEKYGAGGFLLLGCVLSWLGFMISFVVDPAVPQNELIGKSESYILGYTSAYKEIVKSKNINRALIGSFINTGVVVIGGIGLFAFMLSETSKTSSTGGSNCIQSIIQSMVDKACANACSMSLVARIFSIKF